MTIKELEERTGMARANIRYYESEGLLSPRRLSNGYRDYSEEDAQTLEKIKLLRRLHLDLDTIRLVQEGTLTLEQALFGVMNRLEGDKAAIDRAVEVCRELERSGVEYAALEPAQWLEQLEQPRWPGLTPPRPAWGSDWESDPEPVDYACYHPWKRLLARGLDVSIWTLVVNAIVALMFHCNIILMGGLAVWILDLAGLGLSLICEPFLLRFWGWTPGKWIMGLKVRDDEGGKLAVRKGFSRSGGVFISGYGLTIPFFELWRLWKSYQCCRESKDCPWDAGKGVLYTCEPRRLVWLTYIVANAACVFLSVVVALQSFLPPNRGGLTAEEYYENFNFYKDYIMGVTSRRLNDSGEWTDSGSGGVVLYTLAALDYSPVSVTVEDGQVIAVTLTETLNPDPYGGWTSGVTVTGDVPTSIWMDQSYYQIATVALAGAQREFNCFNYGFSKWLTLWENRWSGFELDWRGLHISQTVEYSGYERENMGRYLRAIEGQEQSYSRTVTISLIGSDGR